MLKLNKVEAQTSPPAGAAADSGMKLIGNKSVVIEQLSATSQWPVEVAAFFISLLMSISVSVCR